MVRVEPVERLERAELDPADGDLRRQAVLLGRQVGADRRSQTPLGDSAKNVPMSWLTYGRPMLAAAAVYSDANARKGHVPQVSPVNWIV